MKRCRGAKHRPIRSGTRSRRISSKGAPTSARCKNCSGTSMSSRIPGPRARAPRKAADTSDGDGPLADVAEGSTLDALWGEFKQTHNESLRERLILHYSPLVKYVAGRVSV